MTLQSILFYLVAWMCLGALAAAVTRYCFEYTYDDTPQWPWLRRLILVFYFPFLFGLFGILEIMRCWEREQWSPIHSLFRGYWRLLRQPLMPTANAWDL